MATDYAPETADDVIEELVTLAISITDSHYLDTAIDWDDVLDRMERRRLDDGRGIDWGSDPGSPAVRRLKARVRAARRER